MHEIIANKNVLTVQNKVNSVLKWLRISQNYQSAFITLKKMPMKFQA
jgi:hypothetical protein